MGSKRQRGLRASDLGLDEDLYGQIVDDMHRHAGMHAPAEIWHMDRLFPGCEEKQRRPAFEDLVKPWIGIAADPASAGEIAECRAFLDQFGAPEWTSDHLAPAILGSPPTKADLRTMLDVGLIMSNLDREPDGSLHVLEVGGGYGRLAEGLLRVFQRGLRYVMLDAVPASLYYAYAYLTQRFPERAIGLFYLDAPDPSRFDCYVAPTWHLDRLELPAGDVAVNIASMQEMTREQVSDCLALFDRAVRRGGVIYLSNTRDFAYAHEYEYPPHWRLLFKRNTPLAFSVHYPVEILQPSDRDWTSENAVLEVRYLRQVCAAYREALRETKARDKDTAVKLGDRIAALRGGNDRLKETNRQLRVRLSEQSEALVEVRTRLNETEAAHRDLERENRELRQKAHERNEAAPRRE